MKRTSIQQLKKDFTVFPFPGLGKNDLVDFEFEIYDTKLKKAKAMLAQLPDLIRNLKKIFLTGKEHNELIVKFEENLSSVKSSLNEIKLTVTNQYAQNKFQGIIIGLIFLIICLFLCPFIMIIILALFSYFTTLTLTTSIRKIISQKNTLGHVSAVSGNRIFTNNKGTDREERTISHEHCHLMQFNNIELANLVYDTNLNLSKLLLNNSPTDHERYLFSKIELEVRVHEFIRTVYYKNGEIPTSRDDFYHEAYSFIRKEFAPDALGSDLIACSHTISLSAHDYLHKLNTNQISESELLNLWGQKEKELTDKYICELLFICYINLVRYYGYIDLSKKLGSEIMGPNLYNFTYESNL
ncbi:hypothetical protein P3480_17500 [Vibrio parahaemolyticus]|nr:hypothetical protein [Vibrio parahaemolyticus]